MNQILLINEKPLFLIPKLAVVVGINEAVILQLLHEGVNDSPLKQMDTLGISIPTKIGPNNFPIIARYD